MTVILLTLALLLLIFMRVPIVYAMLIPSLAYILIEGPSVVTAVQQTISGVNSFPLLAAPLFILLGCIAHAGGISERIFDGAASIFGRVRGSLAYVNIVSSFGFSLVSGSAVADAATMGRVIVPDMLKKNYPERFTLGLTAASSLIAPILPPSVPAIIYAVTAGVSVGGVFMAGIGPALLLVFALGFVSWFYTRKLNLVEAPMSFRQRVKALVKALPSMGAAVVVIGGILGGIFTPTEAAAVGCAYMFVLLVVYRRSDIGSLRRIAVESVTSGGSILIIVCSASLFGWILARERAPQMVSDLFLGLTDNPYIFLLLLNITLLLVGAVLEPTSAILILVPVMSPVALSFGLDPLHLAIIVILNLMIGLLTPPIGLVLFTLAGSTGLPVSKVIAGVFPFYGALFAVLMLVTYIPSIALLIPNAVL